MINKINIADQILSSISRIISINPSRCSRIKHKSSDCTLCHASCYSNAITVHGVGESIRIDSKEKCTGCGICINICPTDVFRLRGDSYNLMMNEFLKKIDSENKLKISCSYVEDKKDKGIAYIECIGILNLTDILSLYLSGARSIEIYYGECFDCLSYNGLKIFNIELDELKNLSNIFSNLKDIKITQDDFKIEIVFTKAYPIKEVKQDINKEVLVDRRGLFSFYKRSLKDRVIGVADIFIDERLPDKTIMNFEKYLPKKRIRFLDSIMEFGDLLTRRISSGKYFNKVNIDDKCVYCGMCVRFCPTGALLIDDERSKITFNASKCVSCYLCKPACYHNLLGYDSKIDLNDFFTDVILVEKSEKDENEVKY